MAAQQARPIGRPARLTTDTASVDKPRLTAIRDRCFHQLPLAEALRDEHQFFAVS